MSKSWTFSAEFDFPRQLSCTFAKFHHAAGQDRRTLIAMCLHSQQLFSIYHRSFERESPNIWIFTLIAVVYQTTWTPFWSYEPHFALQLLQLAPERTFVKVEFVFNIEMSLFCLSTKFTLSLKVIQKLLTICLGQLKIRLDLAPMFDLFIKTEIRGKTCL